MPLISVPGGRFPAGITQVRKDAVQSFALLVAKAPAGSSVDAIPRESPPSTSIN